MASTRIYRTAGTPTSTKKFTVSFWCKKSGEGLDQFIFNSTTDASNRCQVQFNDSDQLDFICIVSGSNVARLKTTRKFRDTSAWYHIVAVLDTTESTNTDRIKLYINGEQNLSANNGFASEIYPSQDSDVNVSGTHTVGSYYNGSSASNYLDGSLSHVHFIDGTAYQASTFGSTDSTTGIWKINTSPSVTYGTNGFFLKMEDSSNMDLDSSGNSHSFTTAGTLMSSKDNPSNNFPVLNRMLSATPPTTNGHTTITKTNSGYKPGLATFGAFAGKYYAEFKLETASGYTNFGVVNAFKKKALGKGTSLDYIGDGNDGVAYQPGSSSLYYNGSSQGSYGSASQGDIIAIALDIDNGYVYWRKNDGAWLNSADPTSGSTGTGGFALSNIADTQFGNYYIFGVSVAGTSGTRTISANFGQGFFGTTAVASAGSNASGHGLFEYDVPAGYTALCTKGLNE